LNNTENSHPAQRGTLVETWYQSGAEECSGHTSARSR